MNPNSSHKTEKECTQPQGCEEEANTTVQPPRARLSNLVALPLGDELPSTREGNSGYTGTMLKEHLGIGGPRPMCLENIFLEQNTKN